MKKMRKAESQRIHAKKRAAERFGVELDDASINRIIQDIQSGKTECLYRRTNRISVHLIELAGRLAQCAYDKDRKQIVTFIEFNRKHQ